MCLHVAMEIRELGGNIKKVTVQGFYERNIKKEDWYISTLDENGLLIDSKINGKELATPIFIFSQPVSFLHAF